MSRIEDIEKTQVEQHEESGRRYNQQRDEFNKSLKNVQETLEKKMTNDINDLRKYVKDTTEKVNKSNDNIYGQYDAKLRTIKDVCAQYFSKYEKHLINHQTIVKDLERQ